MPSLYSIEKLDDQNYEIWSVQMRSVLMHTGVWKVISELKPQDLEEKEAAEWKEKDEKALSTLILGCKSTQLTYIKNCKTAVEAWKKLSEVYKPKGPLQKVMLYKKLWNLRMQENEDMATFLNTFHGIIVSLADVGITMQDDLLCIILLSSLPKIFENFIIAMETRDELPSYNALKIKLLSEEKRRSEYEPTSTQQQAFNARSTYKPKKEERKKFNGKCFKCGKMGHYASQCRNEKDKAFSAFVAVNKNIDSNTWCIDSGATAHMCWNKENFENLLPYDEKIELAGNKWIKAQGIGDVKLIFMGKNFTLKDVLYVPELQCNFISVARAIVIFKDRFASIKYKNEEIIKAEMKNNLFLCEISTNHVLNYTNSSNNNLLKWHERYGHLNIQSLKELKNKELVQGLDFNPTEDLKCIPCLKNKCIVKY